MPPRAKKTNEEFGNPFDNDADSPPFVPDRTSEEPESEDKDAALEVTTTSNGEVVVTLKADKGYDAPWVVIHGPNVNDVLNQLRDPGLQDLLKGTSWAAQKFVQSWAEFMPAPTTTRPVSTPQAGSQAPQGQPVNATGHPRGEKKYCQHGEMRWASGVSKSTGKTWYAWDCSLKEDQGGCKREWARL